MNPVDRRMYLALAGLSKHRRRVESARRILQDALARGPTVVSVSWGKDSIAMAHLAMSVDPNVTLLHLASPYGLPGYEACVEYFQARAGVINLEASRSLDEYIAWCREVGLPHERTRSAQTKVVKAIKRDRGAEWMAANGYLVTCLGMRISEGGPRAKLLRMRGPIYDLKDGTTRCCPLAYWTSQDVWAYIVANEIPYNSRLYDAETHGYTRETLRNTGWLSTDDAEHGRIAWLRRHFPEQYRILTDAFPQVSLHG